MLGLAMLARRALLPALFLVLVLPGAGTGHPGHGLFVQVDIGRFAFTPAEATMYAGEEVLWRWVGPDRQHSVTADPGQAETFDSDPGRLPGPTGPPAEEGFSHQFKTPGTFTYHCKVHEGMRGTIVVKPPPTPDPAPRLDALRAPGRARTRVTLRFTLSEPAVVLVEVDSLRRGRPEHLVLSRSRSMAAGPGRLPLNLRRLKRGAYRIQLVPVDSASNAGAAASVRVRVVR
jgi:plastocyanin